MMNWRRGQIPQNDVNLANMSQAHLVALGQQGNTSHEQLLEMQSAQQGMKDVAQKKNIEVPKVNFYPSRNPDPRKARKQDIKQARKLLSPTKRAWYNPVRWIWGRKYRYNRQSNLCVVDGCNCEELIMYDNLYSKICDEESGKSLWEMYWRNPVTQTPEPFVAREKVTNGAKMKGTYCPEHLHLYHLLCKWEAEADKDHNKTKTGMKEMLKKGVSTVAVPISIIKKKDNTPEFLKKYEPFFMELEKDSKSQPGISLLHYKNPETNINDVTMIIFDLRLFQQEMLSNNLVLSDAITNLGIMQRPLPTVDSVDANTNDVINQAGLPQTEQGLFTQ
jgi:hypothetical protein|tara:strand:+ start:2873 stop:3871 length:999 start_codon:yes stop_codon:yes gene_type:complete